MVAGADAALERVVGGVHRSAETVPPRDPIPGRVPASRADPTVGSREFDSDPVPARRGGHRPAAAPPAKAPAYASLTRTKRVADAYDVGVVLSATPRPRTLPPR